MLPISSPRSDTPAQWRRGCMLWAIFFSALAIRWIYDFALFATMGPAGVTGPDSRGYLSDGGALVTGLLQGNLHGWAWLGPDPGVMPLYPWIAMLNIAFAGKLAPLTIVLVQGIIDSGTCLLVYRIAEMTNARFAAPAAIAAAVNPTQIVLSGLVYNDTVFVFFVALLLLGTLSWSKKPSWRAALMIGFGLALAALDRILIVLWAPVLAVILLAASALIVRIRLQHLAQLAAASVILCLAVAPILVRNVTQFGAWSLTDQGGAHLALWVAPLVREAKDGTRWEAGSAEMEKLVRERFPQPSANPFIESQHYAAIGREELARLGLGAMVKAWVVGAAINVATPAIIISPPIAHLPRTGFFATQGTTMLGKIANFLFHSNNAAFAWASLLGVAGVAIIRLLQIFGLYALLRDRSSWAVLATFVLWIGFILITNGPISSPKYRLPIEPLLCVLTGAGYAALRSRRAQASA